jgi:hypothetical protein
MGALCVSTQDDQSPTSPPNSLVTCSIRSIVSSSRLCCFKVEARLTMVVGVLGCSRRRFRRHAVHTGWAFLPFATPWVELDRDHNLVFPSSHSRCSQGLQLRTAHIPVKSSTARVMSAEGAALHCGQTRVGRRIAADRGWLDSTGEKSLIQVRVEHHNDDGTCSRWRQR